MARVINKGHEDTTMVFCSILAMTAAVQDADSSMPAAYNVTFLEPALANTQSPINDLDAVASIRITPGQGRQRAYHWKPNGGVQWIPDPPSRGSAIWRSMKGLDNKGNVFGNGAALEAKPIWFDPRSGTSLIQNPTFRHWQIGATCGGTLAMVDSSTGAKSQSPWYWRGMSELVSVQAPNGIACWPFGVNESGGMVGRAIKNGDMVAWSWQQGVGHQFLPNPSGHQSGAVNAINDRGSAVGFWSRTPADHAWSRPFGATVAFVWRRNADPRVLPNPKGAVGSYAADINGLGFVVGSSTFIGNVDKAVVWAPGKEPRDLNELLVKPSNDWVLETAYRVNSRGSITGVARHAKNAGARVTFVAIPVEP